MIDYQSDKAIMSVFMVFVIALVVVVVLAAVSACPCIHRKKTMTLYNGRTTLTCNQCGVLVSQVYIDPAIMESARAVYARDAFETR